MSEITCATTRSRQRIQVQDHQSSPGFKHFQLVCGNEYVRIEAVYLLSWAILLQKYHGERDVCFPWRHIGAKQLGFWQQANAPGATILASLQEVTKRYYLSQEMKQERVNVNKPILFLDCDQDSQPQFELELHVQGSTLSLHSMENLQIDQVRKMGYTLDHIITSLTIDLDGTLDSISILSPQDISLIGKWNEYSTSPIDCCLHDILEGQARLTPNAEAVCSWDGSMTYHDLDEASTRLGHYLVEYGEIKVEQPTGFAFEKSLNAIVTMIALFKSGALHVPLDPQYPASKLQETIAERRIVKIVCSPTAATNFAPCASAQLIIIDDGVLESSQQLSCTAPCSNVMPHNAATLLFTSGTTGKPKGVILEHNSFATSCRDISIGMQMTSDSRVFQFASFTYDLSISDIFCVFSRGACLCVPCESDRLNDIPHAFSSLRVNHATFTPAVAGQLDTDEVPSLKTLILGGEPLPETLVRRWAGRVALMNIYGITETCAWTTATEPITSYAPTTSIGRSMCGRVWLVDVADFRTLAPIGGIGEIVIEGPTLARHYHDNTKATDQAFVVVPDYLDKQKWTRVYRSGDLARYTSTGDLLYLGRRDTQVKISGQRVELHGIESSMKEHVPENTETVVVVVRPTNRDPVLVGYLALDPTRSWSDRDVEDIQRAMKQALERTLPRHMVPSLFLDIPKLPVSRTGKLDRVLLAQNAVTRIRTDNLKGFLQQPGATPSTELELALQRLWAEALDIDPSLAAKTSNFLHLGDSVAAMKLSKLARKVGFKLDVAAIMSHPILKDMASYCSLQSTSRQQSSQDLVPAFSLSPENIVHSDVAVSCRIRVDEIEDIMFCTPLQEGLMALSLKRPGTYITQEIRRLRRTVDLDKFKKAWDIVAQSNKIMRTRIVESSNQFLQVVCKAPIAWRDSQSLDDYLALDLNDPMLLGCPLTRFALITDAEEWIFVLTRHHATFDGYSQWLIDSQHERTYCDETLPHPPPFSNFIRHLRAVDNHASELWWREELHNTRATSFPVNISARRHERADSVWQTNFTFSRHEQMAVTTAIVVRSAWALLAAKHSLADEVVFGTTLSGRAAPVVGIDQISGPTITTVPVRVRVRPSDTVAEFLSQMQDQSTRMIPHENFGLQNIRKLSEDAESACRFDSLLVVNPQAEYYDNTLYDNDRDDWEGMSRTFAISLQVFLTPAGARVAVMYDDQLLTEWYIVMLMGQLEHMIQQLCSKPCYRLDELSYSSPQDQAQIKSWTKAPVEVVDECVHVVFTHRVAESPNSCAILSWDGTLSYAELDALSTRLAHLLSTSGVVPESVVPICYEKSMWTAVCLMAVVKAGGTFLLLDPTLPESRLQTLISDVHALLVLSSPVLELVTRRVAKTVFVVCPESVRDLPDIPGSPCLSVRSNNTLYVIFSSGTTGKPKGSALDHQAYASSARAMQKALRLSSKTKALHFASHSFDACVEQLLATLMYGGTVCIPSDFQRDNDLVAAINRMGVNFMRLTPSFARTLDTRDIPTVKTVNLIGEAMNQTDLDQWRHTQLFEGWGPSECTNSSGIFDVTRSGISDWATRKTGLCATASVDLYLVDPNDHRKLSPLGGVGEIVIDGANVAKGYINDPEKTALSFVDRPEWLQKESCLPGRKLYKTGDLARHGPDGSIIFIGRKNATQVKIRGQRLELGEVESQIQRFLPAFTQVVVEAIIPAEAQDPVLVAFICLETQEDYVSMGLSDMISQDFTHTDQWISVVATIETALIQVVSRFMVPSFWIPSNFIPSLGSNKIDRRFMKDYASKLTLDQLAAYTGVRTCIRQPNTRNEGLLHQLWSDVLRLDPMQIGLDHSWFRLGGNSIDAMRLVTKARKIGLLLTVVDVFDHPRLEDMAAACILEDHMTSVDRSLPISIEPFSLLDDPSEAGALRSEVAKLCNIATDKIEDLYPCTALQQGLMAISVKSPGREMAQFTFQISTHTDISRLRDAWQLVAKIAPILRTRIVETTRSTLQVVVDEEMEWVEQASLQDYLQEDTRHFMGLGSRLCRLALATDDNTAEPHLCLSMHHSIYDGWSLKLILDRVEENFHNRTVAADSPPFNSLIAHLQRQDKRKANDFWATQFADTHTDIFPRLPSSTYPPSADTFVEKVIHLDDKRPMVDFTTAAIIQGAWALVVAAHTANNDVVFGSTVHGRNIDVPGLENMMGPTFTTIPVRIQINNEMSVKDFLNHVQRGMVKSVGFEHLGLQNIRNISEQTRKACNFQNVLVVQSEDVPATLEGVLGPRQSRDDPSSLNSYGIMLDVKPSRQSIVFGVSYDSLLIDSVQMRRILDQTAHTLRHLLDPENLEQELSSIIMLSPEDVQQISTWNAPYPRTIHKCIHDIIGTHVSRAPHAEALCAWDGSFSYLELDQLSSRLAAYLVDLGVETNQIITLCFDKSVWTVIAMLAVMKSGAAFVLLDPAHHPVKRMEDTLYAAQSKLLLCGPAYRLTLMHTVQTVITVSRSAIERLPREFLNRRDTSSPQDMLCVLFTSGSTGMPKGIVHNHEGFATSFDAFGPALGIDLRTRLLQFSAYAFDACVGDMLAPLMHGGCVCIPSEDQRMNDITGAINNLSANWALLTPSFARSLCPSDIPGLETVLLGGEAILPSDEVLWSDRTLLTGYGPAESSLCMAAAIGDKVGRHAPNLGWPVACRTWVTNVRDHRQLVPIGVPGHLIVEGPVNAAGGYLNDPVKTAASFIPEYTWIPETQAPTPQRFFKTGDLVRYASDGSLIFMGRLDTQIKLRGQRVEVDEVEYHLEMALSERASIGTKIDSAVTMTSLPGSNISKSALAIFVGQPSWCEWTPEVGKTLSDLLTYVQQYLSQRIPSYMIPSLIIPIEKLPFTISEKLDRKQLTKIASDIPEEKLALYTRRSSIGTSPANNMERQLLSLFAQVLQCDPDKIFADDTLLRLGGDSISAMRLVALARAQGLTLTVADIFNHGSPKELAPLVTTTSEGDEKDPLPFSTLEQTAICAILSAVEDHYDIPSSMVKDVLPCTALQAGLMSLTIVRQGTYVAENIFELPHKMDLMRLQQSWAMLVRLNDILRTRIIEFDENFYQIILEEEIEIPLVYTSLKSVSVVEMGLGLPLNRFRIVVDIPADKRHFIWYSHHSTYDGWSVRLLLDQFETICDGQSPQPLPSFSRFIRYLNSKNDLSSTYWKSQVEGLEVVTFPALPHESTQPSGLAKLITKVDLSRESYSTATVSTLIRSALAIVLSQWCPETTTPSLGVVLAGRTGTIQSVDKIAGPTLTTVPIVISVCKSETVASFLMRVQQQAVDMLSHEQFGLQNIARLSEACKRATQFQTLLAIQPLETYDISSDKLMRLLPSGEQDSAFYTYGLTLQCFLHEEAFDLKVNFDSSMMSESDVKRLIEQFDHVIHQLAGGNEEKTVGQIEMLDPAQREQVLNWNALPLDAEHVRMVTHEKIANIAALNPQWLAVQSWDLNLTYANLVETSSRLAGYLQSLDVGPSSIVPICFEKSAWALISQLAVLQAGAAFVALDPSYPANRMRQILGQIGSARLLTSEHTEHLFKDLGLDTVQVSAELIAKIECKYFKAPLLSRNDLMYIIYTSGSTGQPKGVMIEHGAFDASSSRYGPALGLDENSRVLQFASYVFDASVLETFTTLSLGGCVCIPGESDRAANLAAVMCQQDVNWALLTPSVLRLLVPDNVPSLRTLVVGAEAVGREVIQSWFNHVRLYQAYGPAECSIICTTSRVRSIDDDPRIIGKPINCHAWIVDSGDHNRLSGIGCIGELVIDGPTLSRGYLADPQKTEAAYMYDPPWASATEGESTHSRRFYKTGDLVKYTSDGCLIFMGRKDSQVKINGQRVEIGEIEHQIRLLLNEPIDVTVEVIDDSSNGKAIRLGAVISFGDTQSLSNDTPRKKLAYLKSTLPTVLPSHMVPSLFLHLDQTPLNYAGKTDRRQIRSLLRTVGETKNTDQQTAPSTAQELELQPLWEKILGCAAGTTYIEDDFFSRGDSISAIRLASAARKIGLKLSAADIFRKREFGLVARCLRQLSTISDGLVRGPSKRDSHISMLNRVHTSYNISEDDIEAIYPCLDTQEHLMRESLANSGSNVMRITYALDDAIDLDTFKRTWELVVASTEILRTRIVETVDADMVQLLLKSEFAWEDTIDLNTYLIEDTNRPLQLGLPLVRYALVRNHKSTFFVWTIHHALYDGWSLPLLLSRVEATYSSLLSNKSTCLDHASLRSLVERQMARNAAAEGQFWTWELSDATVAPYPSTKRLDMPRSTDYVERIISILKTCIEPEYATANLIRAAWAMVLANNSGTADVTYGTFLAGRSAPVEDIEQLIGPVLAKIPVRVRIEQGMTVRALLTSTREQAMRMLAREHIGIHRIAELGTSYKDACKFQTMLVIHPSETNGIFESQMGMRKLQVSGHHPHELVIEAVLSNDDSVQLKASWDKRALSTKQVETLLAQIERVITSLSSESLANAFVQDLV